MAEFERYLVSAKELKKISVYRKTKAQAALRQLNYYSLGIFAAVLIEQIAILSLRVPNVNIHSRKNVKAYLSQASNILESVVGGLARKTITKEIARKEIEVASKIIHTIEVKIKAKGDDLKQAQIMGLPSNKSQAAFKSIDLADLGDYVRTLQKIDTMLKPISDKLNIPLNPTKTLQAPTFNSPKDDNLPNDPYASPSKYTGYMDNVTKQYHNALQKASKLIVIPKNIGPEEDQVLWSISRLPVYVVTVPALKTFDLEKAGIKYDELAKNSFILYNQIVLVIYTGNILKTENGKKVSEKENFVDYAAIVNRAKLMIREQFNTSFLYSKPFKSKEIKKPLEFYWLLPPGKLPKFETTTIGLPFAPELKALDDLTYNVETIRRERDEADKQALDRAQERRDAAEPLFAQRNAIENQIKETNKAVKAKKDQLEILKAGHVKAKLDLMKMRPNSPDWQKQNSRIIALESQIGVLTDEIINESKVRVMGLKQKLNDLIQSINEFNGART